jgi:hypothetical protein
MPVGMKSGVSIRANGEPYEVGARRYLSNRMGGQKCNAARCSTGFELWPCQTSLEGRFRLSSGDKGHQSRTNPVGATGFVLEVPLSPFVSLSLRRRHD